jgi:hypothetical protein
MLRSQSDAALPATDAPTKKARAEKKKKKKKKKKRKEEEEDKKERHEKDKRKRGFGDDSEDSEDSEGPAAVAPPSSGKKRQRTDSASAAADAPISAAAVAAGSGNYLVDAAAEYLRVWDADRAAWKFKKNRQTWLLKNMWHPGMVRGPSFVLLLRYLEGLKGAARQKTLEQAQKILDEGLEEGGGIAAGGNGDAAAKSVGLAGSADPVAVEKQRKVTEKLRRIRFSRADALARLLC